MWKLDDTTLTNKANIWQSTDKWTVKTKDSLVCLENSSNETVLSIADDGTVIQNTFAPNEPGQLWLKRDSSDGFFILTNPQTQKVLTAGSDHHFETTGTCLDNLVNSYLKVYQGL